jgi:hypothetical protein
MPVYYKNFWQRAEGTESHGCSTGEMKKALPFRSLFGAIAG